jgi:hypothetical protein
LGKPNNILASGREERKVQLDVIKRRSLLAIVAEAKVEAEQRRRTLGLEATATDAECKAAEVRRPLLLVIESKLSHVESKLSHFEGKLSRLEGKLSHFESKLFVFRG